MHALISTKANLLSTLQVPLSSAYPACTAYAAVTFWRPLMRSKVIHRRMHMHQAAPAPLWSHLKIADAAVNLAVDHWVAVQVAIERQQLLGRL
jgi:hypothetical protein